MGEQEDHGSVATDERVTTELHRIIRELDRTVPAGYSAFVFRIIRDTVMPDLTIARWRELAGAGRLAEAQEAQEARERRQAHAIRRRPEIEQILRDVGFERYSANAEMRALFRGYGYYIETSAFANAGYMADWEAQNPEPVAVVLRSLTGEPPAQSAEEEEEPTCQHAPRCQECNGTGCGDPDRWGDFNGCRTECPHCDQCEASHQCSECGLDPGCEHEFVCTNCDVPLEPCRYGWEVRED